MNKYFLNFDTEIYNNILSLKKKDKLINNKIFKNLQRNTIIIPSFVNKKFSVNTGKYYKVIKITKDMIGSKVGIYVKTKTYVDHSKKIK